MEILNIEIEEKTDYTLSLTYRDKLTGLPIDITGYSAILQVRTSFGSDVTPLLELTSIGGEIVLGAGTGSVDIIFTPDTTDQTIQGWTQGSYDLVLFDILGKKDKLLKGFITIAKSATR